MAEAAPPPVPNAANHIGQFETLRGVAALWVFVSHSLLISEYDVPVLSHGGLAVDLFVILSGFVITLLIRRRAEPYPLYIFRRFIRLYPLYCIALLMGTATTHLYGPVVGAAHWGGTADANFLTRETIFEQRFWEHLLLHLTMMHGVAPDTLLPQSALSFSGPLWSISLEWQFYLVAPLLVWALDLRQPGRWPWFVIAVAGIITARMLALRHWQGEVPSFLPLKLDLFAIGIVCGHWWNTACKANVRIILGGATIATLVFVPWMSGKIPLLMWIATYAVAATGQRTGITRPVNRLLNARLPRWIGERSYGLYVLHMPLLLALAWYLILPAAPRLGQVGVLLALLACVTVVIALAAALYRGVEQPAIRWAKRLGARSRPAFHPAPSITTASPLIGQETGEKWS